MAPQRPMPADSNWEAEPSLDAPEPDFTTTLEQYCDLRRRGFSHTEIQTNLQLRRHQPSLLLAEAARRGMSGSQENQSDAIAEWLLSCFDTGIEISAIRRMSALTERGIKQRLKRALDTASGNPPSGLITPAPDGTPGRVSWLDPGGRLMHRPFDGAFPAHYTAETALAQCCQVVIELLDHPEGTARDRAYTTLHLAQSGVHTFDREAGRELYDAMDNAELDDDAKRTVVLKLHDHPHVQQLLLQMHSFIHWVAGRAIPSGYRMGLRRPPNRSHPMVQHPRIPNSATALTPHQCRLKCGGKAASQPWDDSVPGPFPLLRYHQRVRPSLKTLH